MPHDQLMFSLETKLAGQLLGSTFLDAQLVRARGSPGDKTVTLAAGKAQLRIRHLWPQMPKHASAVPTACSRGIFIHVSFSPIVTW